MKKLLILILICLPELIFCQKSSAIVIETRTSVLVYRADNQGILRQIYLGVKLQHPAEYDLLPVAGVPAYPTFGTNYRREPALKVIHADNNVATELFYKSVSISKIDDNISVTSITLTDPVYPLQVVLRIKAYHDEDIFEQWVEIQHQEKKPVILESFASSVLGFARTAYYLNHFNGDWAREMQFNEDVLTPGIKTVESRLGSRAQILHSPSFIVSFDQASSEQSGEVIGGTLAWSGNFKLDFEVDEEHRLNVLAGMNPYASSYTLQPKEVFKTPALLFAYSPKGKEIISINFHRWARKYGIKKTAEPRSVLLNNWEATYFDFDEKKLVSLFDDAKKLGTDLFLLDDGWFGNKFPRNDDRAGLGDWQVNKRKLPNGINALIDSAKARNLTFGIWIEPEMVNPESDLYRNHPDWIIRLPNRPEDLQRNQLVLDLSNPNVREFIFGTLDDLITQHPEIAYIKWDCNRYFSNAYSPYLKNQSHIYIEYVRGLYEIMQRFTRKYSNLPLMLCSGGGGRVDYGSLPYFNEFWPSDMTDPLKRIYIQWGYSYFFPAISMCAHVTSMGSQPLKFKLDVAMSGKLGFDLVPSRMSMSEQGFAQRAIDKYREIQPIIADGDMYRLISPLEDTRAVMMYVSPEKKQALLFGFQTQTSVQRSLPTVVLRGLDREKQYRVEEINMTDDRAKLASHGKLYSGDYLMTIGLSLPLDYDYSSVVILLREQKI